MLLVIAFQNKFYQNRAHIFDKNIKIHCARALIWIIVHVPSVSGK